MTRRILLALPDLADSPANRSLLTLGAWAVDAGHEVRVLTAHAGPLEPEAAALGDLVLTDAVNEWGPARLLARLRLGPLARIAKSRRLRGMVRRVGSADRVVAAGPEGLDLLGWLPGGNRPVAVVVSGGDLPLEGRRLDAVGGCAVIVADRVASGAVGGLGPAVVDAGLVVVPPAAPPSEPLVAVSGLAEGAIDRFVDVARSIRRAVPATTIGWVRADSADEDRWSWPFFSRGDLADLAGGVVGLPPTGAVAVTGVVAVGSRHPLVSVAAKVAAVPVIDASSGTEGLEALDGGGAGPDEAFLAAHDVTRVGPRLLAALDGG